MNRRQVLGGLVSLATPPRAGADLQDCEPCVAVHPPPWSPHRKLRVKPVMTTWSTATFGKAPAGSMWSPSQSGAQSRSIKIYRSEICCKVT